MFILGQDLPAEGGIRFAGSTPKGLEITGL